MGKIVGAVVGAALFRIPGAILGLIIGHQFDSGVVSWRLGGSRKEQPRINNPDTQRVFFETTFLIMGHIAKADGRVSEGEIEAARSVMVRMRLRDDQIKAAMRLFYDGKRPDLAVAQLMRNLQRVCRHRGDLQRAFLEIQVAAAVASGGVSPSARDILWRICKQLNVSRVELAQMEAFARLQHRAGNRRERPSAPAADGLTEAYKVLGVERSASDAEVKTAYRRLMNKHHPDKLVAHGMPEEMLGVAKEKALEINSAYDRVKEARGMK